MLNYFSIVRTGNNRGILDAEGTTQNIAPDCHLSFVVTTRNDNHGGDMLRRFQMFAETLLEQANRHSLAENSLWSNGIRRRGHGFMRF